MLALGLVFQYIETRFYDKTIFIEVTNAKGKGMILGIPSKSSGRQNPPTPAGVKRCQIRECSELKHPKPKLSGPIWTMIGIPNPPKI